MHVIRYNNITYPVRGNFAAQGFYVHTVPGIRGFDENNNRGFRVIIIPRVSAGQRVFRANHIGLEK